MFSTRCLKLENLQPKVSGFLFIATTLQRMLFEWTESDPGSLESNAKVYGGEVGGFWFDQSVSGLQNKKFKLTHPLYHQKTQNPKNHWHLWFVLANTSGQRSEFDITTWMFRPIPKAFAKFPLYSGRTLGDFRSRKQTKNMLQRVKHMKTWRLVDRSVETKVEGCIFTHGANWAAHKTSYGPEEHIASSSLSNFTQILKKQGNRQKLEKWSNFWGETSLLTQKNKYEFAMYSCGIMHGLFGIFCRFSLQ